MPGVHPAGCATESCSSRIATEVPIAVAGRGPRVQHLAATEAGWVIRPAKGVTELPATAAAIRRPRAHIERSAAIIAAVPARGGLP